MHVSCQSFDNKYFAEQIEKNEKSEKTHLSLAERKLEFIKRVLDLRKMKGNNYTILTTEDYEKFMEEVMCMCTLAVNTS